MAGLSKAQVTAMLDMGDTMIRQGVDYLENPAVNGRTLAVLEREGYVFYASLAGGWVFTAQGYGTYDSLDISRHVNTGHPRMVKPVDRVALIASERAVSVPMWDDVTPVAVDDVLIFKGNVVYVESIIGDTYTLRGWNRPGTDELTSKTWAIYVRQDNITRVTHNCGTCGPRAQAGCGWCYPCDRTGRRVLPAGSPEVTEGMKLWNPAEAQVLTVVYVDITAVCLKYPNGSESVLDTDWVRIQLGNGNWEIMSPDAASTDAEQDSLDRAQASVDAVTVCECGTCDPCRVAVDLWIAENVPARCVLEGDGLSVRTSFRMVHASPCTCVPVSRDTTAAGMILSLILADAELCGYEVTVTPTTRVPRKVKKASKIKSTSRSRRAHKG